MITDKTIVPYDEISEKIGPSGTIAIACHCGAPLDFQWIGRGTPESRIVVTHGTGEARMITRASEDRWLLWVLELADPIGEWIDRLHAYEAGR